MSDTGSNVKQPMELSTLGFECMRQLGNIGASAWLEESFADIVELSRGCRFTGCTHTRETGCALISAVKDGRLCEERYQSYLKLMKESEYNKMSYVE